MLSTEALFEDKPILPSVDVRDDIVRTPEPLSPDKDSGPGVDVCLDSARTASCVASDVLG